MSCLFNILNIFLTAIFLLGFSSCQQSSQQTKVDGPLPVTSSLPALSESDLEKMSKEEIMAYLKKKATTSTPQAQSAASTVVNMENSLSFPVKNCTGAAFYCCCFYYLKNKLIGRWRWDKSKIYKIKPGQTRYIILDESVDDERDRNFVFGYLGVFKDREEALRSVMEMVDETKLLDLDLLAKIKGKVIEVGVKKYGIKGERLAYAAQDEAAKEAFVSAAGAPAQQPNLDLLVENRSGKDVYLTCFVYEQPEHTHQFDLWLYNKTEIKKVADGTQTILPIPCPQDQYRWSYMRGMLGVFSAEEKDLAQKATFELTQPINKLDLGLLTNLMGQKIILSAEHYGIIGDFIDYVVKPANFVNKRSKKV